MRRYILSRLATLLPVLLGLSLITFGLIALLPGDPAEVLARRGREVEPSPQQIEAVRRELGLDQPVVIQYLRWLGGAVRGDLGDSLDTGQPVWDEIMARLPATLELALAGLTVGVLIAVPIGVLAAVWQGSWLDQISRALALLGAAIPSFWLGAMLILLFAVKLQWLPAMGRGSPQQILLPALALGIGTSAAVMRLTRASLLETLSEDYVRTARAKGLRERTVVLIHALKPALLPVKAALMDRIKAHLSSKLPTAKAFNVPDKAALVLQRDLAESRQQWIDAVKDEPEEHQARHDSDFLKIVTHRGKADFHSLRHTFGTLLAESGVHPKVAMDLMRHSDINLTLALYTHSNDDRQAAAIDGLPDFETVKEEPKIQSIG